VSLPERPADMLETGPVPGRCDRRERLPGLDDDVGPWRCGRMACHAGEHRFHPEFDPVLGPIIARARAAEARRP
jgi:hypothetical protein